MTRIDLVIIGAGRQGAETLEIARAISREKNTINVVGFLDDARKGGTVDGVPILGGIEQVDELIARYPKLKAIIAVGDTESRKKLAERFGQKGLRFCKLIHPTAVISEHVTIGPGTTIAAGSVFTVNIRIGSHVLINPNSSIAHDAQIDDFVTINALCAISGNNHIEEGVYLGVGSSTIQGVKIGAWSVIGAGATVINNIPKGVVAVGVPAKVIKKK